MIDYDSLEWKQIQYGMLVRGLQLLALPAEKQIRVLPDFVDVPFECVNDTTCFPVKHDQHALVAFSGVTLGTTHVPRLTPVKCNHHADKFITPSLDATTNDLRVQLEEIPKEYTVCRKEIEQRSKSQTQRYHENMTPPQIRDREHISEFVPGLAGHRARRHAAGASA